MHENNLKLLQIITFLSQLSSMHDSTNILCFKNDIIAQKCVIYLERKKERKKRKKERLKLKKERKND